MGQATVDDPAWRGGGELSEELSKWGETHPGGMARLCQWFQPFTE